MTESLKLNQCGKAIIESFQAHRTHSTLKQLPLDNYYHAAAPYSGPIALLFRKHDQKLNKPAEPYLSSIILFDCRGEMLRTVPFDLK